MIGRQTKAEFAMLSKLVVFLVASVGAGWAAHAHNWGFAVFLALGAIDASLAIAAHTAIKELRK